MCHDLLTLESFHPIPRAKQKIDQFCSIYPTWNGATPLYKKTETDPKTTIGGSILQSLVCTFADHVIQIYRISEIGKIDVGLTFSLSFLEEVCLSMMNYCCSVE
jgi:hypothetical protein